MSRFDYLESKRLAMEDASFAALIMAAYRRADTANALLLRGAFPDLVAELQARYNAPGGLLDADPKPGSVSCDHCGAALWRDVNNYWADANGVSDCPANAGGHTVNGQPT